VTDNRFLNFRVGLLERGRNWHSVPFWTSSLRLDCSVRK